MFLPGSIIRYGGTKPSTPRFGFYVAGILGLFSALGIGCGRSSAAPTRSSRNAVASDPMPAEWFQEATIGSGIKFVHRAGTNYSMPDQIGAGVVVFDCDGDGLQDLYFVQNGGTQTSAHNQLYRQRSDGIFENISEGSGADLVGQGMGAIAGDVNNDGRPDLVVTEYGAVRLLENLGNGHFRETLRVGLDNPHWAVPASFIDFDRDGWLDLVVGNYVDYDPTQTCVDALGRPDFCAPRSFGPTLTRLWRNVTGRPGAEPRFEDRTVGSGLARVPGMALGMVAADLNGDGWPDLFIADDGRPNRLFINQKNGVFIEEAAWRGLAFNAMGHTAANMGIAFADVDGDGLGDLFVTHLSGEFHAYYHQDQPGLFRDEIAPAELQQMAWRGTGFGVVFADFDLDGKPDLILVNGLVQRAEAGQTPVAQGVSPWWARYAQKAQVFSNRGGGRFRDISAANPALCGSAMVGRSLAIADLDRDGKLDLVLSGAGGPARIYHGIASTDGHWLHVRLVDEAHGGRDELGAELVLHAGQRQWWAVLQPATSYLVSHEPALHFGLGSETKIDYLEVHWPEGSVERFAGGTVNRRMVLRKGEGSTRL